MMRRTGKKANMQTWILLITTIPQRKVIEYIASTLHILRKLQTRDTALRIIEHQDLNTISLNQNIIWTPDQNNIKGTKIQMYTSLPHHPQKIMVMAWKRLWKNEMARTTQSQVIWQEDQILRE